MERFGFQPGGHILEPSMGIGHFFGLMPESLYPGTRRTGVELDSITARIAAKLYPDSNLHGKALEDTALPKDFFDAAVGNIPFGNYPVFDPAYRRTPQLTRGVHDEVPGCGPARRVDRGDYQSLHDGQTGLGGSRTPGGWRSVAPRAPLAKHRV
jgi:hypothetical protein